MPTSVFLILIVFSAAFLFLFITFLRKANEEVLYKSKFKKSIAAMIFLGLSLLFLMPIEPLIFKRYTVLPILLWLCIMILIILNMISMKKYLSAAPEISAALFEHEKYKELAHKLSRGHVIYGNELPPRGAYFKNNDRKEYMKSFMEFYKIDFPENAEELRSLQNLIHKNRIIAYTTITLGIVWFLQVPMSILILILTLAN